MHFKTISHLIPDWRTKFTPSTVHLNVWHCLHRYWDCFIYVKRISRDSKVHVKMKEAKNFTFSFWVFRSNVRSSLLRYDTRKIILLKTSCGSSLPPPSGQSKKRQYLLRKVSTYMSIFAASHPRPMIMHHHCYEKYKPFFQSARRPSRINGSSDT